MIRSTSSSSTLQEEVPDKTARGPCWAPVDAATENNFEREEETFLTLPVDGGNFKFPLSNKVEDFFRVWGDLPFQPIFLFELSLPYVATQETG